MTSPVELYFVDKRVYPHKSLQREYFANRELAERVADFYSRYQEIVPMGIDIVTIDKVVEEVVYPESGVRLKKTGPSGALYPVCIKFDIVERANDIRNLAGFVSAQIKEAPPIQWS